MRGSVKTSVRRGLSLFLVVVMFLGMLPAVSIPVHAGVGSQTGGLGGNVPWGRWASSYDFFCLASAMSIAYRRIIEPIIRQAPNGERTRLAKCAR